MTKHLKPAMLYLFILAAFAASCSRKSAAPTKNSEEATAISDEKHYLKQDYKKAVVYDYTGKLDGCTFVIKTVSDGTVEPVNLREEFMADSLPVWVKYEVVKDRVSICMVGSIVRIIDIQKR